MHNSTGRDSSSSYAQDLIDQLASWLHDDYQAVRAEAARTLAKSGEPGLHALVAALDDERVDVRQQAAFGLGETGSENAVSPLARALDDLGMTYFAIYALGALGRNGVRSAAQPLIRTLKHAEGSLLARAAAELGFMMATEGIPYLLAMLADPDAMVRYSTVDALGEMGDRSVISRLIELLPNADGDMKSHIIRALERLGAGEEMIEPVVECLGSESRGVNSAAAHALARLGAPALPVLAVAQQGSPTARAWALWTLYLLHKQHQVCDQRVLETALEALSDSDAEVRARGAEVLDALGDPHGFEPLLVALNDPEKRVRAAATFALRSFGPRAFEPLANQLRHGITSRASLALAHLGDPRAFEVLLYGPNGDGENSSPFGLAKLARQSVALQQRLHGELKSSNPKVRRTAAMGLGLLGEIWAWEPIAALLSDEDAGVRLGALSGLSTIDAQRALPILIAALDDEASQARQRVMLDLSYDEAAWDATLLLPAIENPDPDVRYFVASKLGEFGDERALDALFARRTVESGMTSEGQSVRDELIRAAKLIQVRMLATT
jgi:HEAT repeat protein